jgi:hypothetical protein
VKTGGVRTDVSIHLYFDADQTVFRVIMRVGGNPWWKTSIARKNGSNNAVVGGHAGGSLSQPRS